MTECCVNIHIIVTSWTVISHVHHWSLLWGHVTTKDLDILYALSIGWTNPIGFHTSNSKYMKV